MALLSLEIIKKEVAAIDAVILYFKEANNVPIAYEAGQFFTFIIEINGKELRRSYSIASAPGVDKDPFVVVKRQTNGEVSRFIIDHYNVGDRIAAVPPSGRFTVNSSESSGKSIFFIAAGSGISPIFSLIKKLLYDQPTCDIMLIYQNRNEEHMIFKDDLTMLSTTFPERFHLISLFSAPLSGSDSPMRLNNYLLEKLLLSTTWFNPETSLHYICGPRAFMRLSQFVLKLLHVPNQHIRQEEYVIDFFPPPPFMTDLSYKSVTIHWEGKQSQFVMRYPDNILQGALHQHLKLPYSCRGGKCSTCMARCVSGKVKMSINQVLTKKDLEEGWILTCVSYPETDVVLEF